MKTITVKVREDHLERLTSARSPIAAVAELMWNGLDADATEVQVCLLKNLMGGLEGVRVSDNGHGILYSEVVEAFENLGGSWKRERRKTRGGRIIHGEMGKGRFRAFFLGENVQWTTRYLGNDQVLEYRITGQRSDLRSFQIDEATSSRQKSSTGTEVEITHLLGKFAALRWENAEEAITEEFALYLRQYPMVKIDYDGRRIDPSLVEERVTDYELKTTPLADGRLIPAALTIIEWKSEHERALYLCNGDGFTLAQMPTGIHAPRFQFTAYLKSDYLRELDRENALVLEDLHPDLRKFLTAAKDQMRSHFRERAASLSVNLVEEWKREEIYPYKGEAQGPVELAERQVFDVVALNLHSYLPDFDESAAKTKRLTFCLIREALESSPSSVQRVIEEVLDLPKEKVEELAELLQRTSLEAVINASKVVADRIDFLRGLETLVFEPKSRRELLERRQLHRIVAEHTWVFGEEFNLTVDDEALTTVLKRHLEGLGIELTDARPVLLEDDSIGRVDLMFSRRVALHPPDEREHLVVELKRPSVKIDDSAETQIKKYAFAVANDERFRDTNTRWVFWAVSNEISDSVQRSANQRNRPKGLLYEDPEGRIFIWVRTWGQVIEECGGRLKFFQDRLKYWSNAEDALEYLRKTHEKYLPPSLKEETTSQQD